MPDRGRRRPCPSCPPCSGAGNRTGCKWSCPAGGDNAKFVQLKEAILSRRVLSFTYVGASGQTTRRSVLPARLVFKSRDWYLQGFCLERAAYRTFKLTRMLEPEPGAPFQRPLSPPPIEAGEPPEGFCIPVRLRFSPALAYRVYDEFDEGCVTRGADGSLVVSVSFPEDPWLYGYLLSFGLGVEVLEPERLRKRLALLAGKMAAHHGNHDTGCQDNCDRMEPSQSQEESHMNHTFCQSCGMPIDDPALRGTERGGTPSEHYCKYCYQEGAFTGEMTMEEMIDFCTPMMVRANPELTPEQARAQMAQFFPSLLRWRN